MPRSAGIIAGGAAGVAALVVTFGLGLMMGSASPEAGPAYPVYRDFEATPRQTTSAPARYRAPCRNAEGREESDLCAQWKAARAAEAGALWTERGFWVGLLSVFGLALTIYFSQRSTSAAIEALEAQISSDRPLMQLGGFWVGREGMQPFADDPRIGIRWWLANHGATACWTECVNLILSAYRPDDPRHHADGDFVENVISFVPPGKGVGRAEKDVLCDFGGHPEERAAFVTGQRFYLSGYCIYRDAGRRRWKTGFAGFVEVNDEFVSGQSPFSFFPSDRHWFDERL